VLPQQLIAKVLLRQEGGGDINVEEGQQGPEQ